MKLPNAVRVKLLGRFDGLIAEAQDILQRGKLVQPEVTENMFGERVTYGRGYIQLDLEQFVEWRSKVATLLSLVIPKGHIHRETVDALPTVQGTEYELKKVASLLKAIKNDFEQGFLDSLFSQIEAAIAADYMGQAEGLLAEGQRGMYDHVPAAVLAGAVLEGTLRALCAEQQPPVPVANADGEPKMLNRLIDDLKKAEVFNELKAKQLRSWADVRNKAAHGEFSAFSRSDVEQMVQGVNNFLADYR